MSSPRDALSAISSADNGGLDVFGIALLFLFSRPPGCDKVVVFALRVMPDLKNHGTKASIAPANGTELFRIVVLLVDQVDLIKNLLRLTQADTMLLFDGAALGFIELEADIRI